MSAFNMLFKLFTRKVYNKHVREMSIEICNPTTLDACHLVKYLKAVFISK